MRRLPWLNCLTSQPAENVVNGLLGDTQSAGDFFDRFLVTLVIRFHELGLCTRDLKARPPFAVDRWTYNGHLIDFSISLVRQDLACFGQENKCIMNARCRNRILERRRSNDG